MLAGSPVSGGQRKHSQDDGIVCKHEDLVSLLTEATKQSLVKTLSSDSSRSVSPTSRKASLKCQPAVRSLSSDKPPQEQPSNSTKASSPLPAIVTDDCVQVAQECTTDLDEEEEEGEGDGEDGQVQWDETNSVDAFVLGDAIEAFLKGINQTPGPALPRHQPPAPAPAVEKRVSFKKC